MRPAAAVDAPLLARLDTEIFGDGAYPERSWQTEIENAAGKVFLAGFEKNPIAFLSLLIAGDDTEIRKIGVLPPWRRQGIAQKLIRYALERESKGRCLIDVSETNTAALLFYRRMGFTKLARRKKYYADGSDAIVMEHIK